MVIHRSSSKTLLLLPRRLSRTKSQLWDNREVPSSQFTLCCANCQTSVALCCFSSGPQAIWAHLPCSDVKLPTSGFLADLLLHECVLQKSPFIFSLYFMSLCTNGSASNAYSIEQAVLPKSHTREELKVSCWNIILVIHTNSNWVKLYYIKYA